MTFKPDSRRPSTIVDDAVRGGNYWLVLSPQHIFPNCPRFIPDLKTGEPPLRTWSLALSKRATDELIDKGLFWNVRDGSHCAARDTMRLTGTPSSPDHAREWRHRADLLGRRPDSLRGPQFAAAWCDELAKWRYAEETWDMLQLGLRLGSNPRQVVTTTPRPVPILKRLLV